MSMRIWVSENGKIYGENDDKPLELGVSYFQTPFGGKFDSEALAIDSQTLQV